MLVEEACHLLRRGPRAALAAYYIGTLPMVLAMLYFIQDMSLHTYAYRRLGTFALLLTALFAWMKVWQGQFAHSLRAFQSGLEAPPLTWRRLLRQGAQQVTVQSWGMGIWLVLAQLMAAFGHGGQFSGAVQVLVIIVGLELLLEMLALLTGWRSYLPITSVLSFFQNFTVLADGQTSLRHALGESLRLCQRNNRGAAGSLPLLFLVAGLLILNIAFIIYFIPVLLQGMLGIDTVFSRSGQAAGNTTLWSVAIGLTYLLVDPLAKSLHVLLCFYGLADRTGEDLRARFNRAKALAAACVLGLLLAMPVLAQPAEASHATGPLAQQLDQQIDQVITDEQYSWRPLEDREHNTGLINAVDNTLQGWWAGIKGWFNDQDKASQPSPPSRSGGSGGSGGGSRGSSGGGGGHDWSLPQGDGLGSGGLTIILYILLIVAVLAVLAIVAKFIHSRLKEASEDADEDGADAAMQAQPDLSEETTTADQLPEEGWLGMAADLLAKGEYRLALRAMYLACLAGLGQREMVKITRAKSNHDYVLELRRRSHAAPGLLAPFEENVGVFETAWYGMHDVTLDTVNHFRDNQQRMYQIVTRG